MLTIAPATPATRSGLAQLAAAATLAAFVPFLSNWRLLLAADFTAYLIASGGALVVYGASRRALPLRGLATTWLPVGVPFLLLFVALFGGGLAAAESGTTGVGLALLAGGYAALPAGSAVRLIGSFRGRPRPPV